jgi:hypothetical protein
MLKRLFKFGVVFFVQHFLRSFDLVLADHFKKKFLFIFDIMLDIFKHFFLLQQIELSSQLITKLNRNLRWAVFKRLDQVMRGRAILVVRKLVKKSNELFLLFFYIFS